MTVLPTSRPRTLVLFTSTFPFGHGETFLESELPVLARHFETVVVHPAAARAGAPFRSIPSNAIVGSPISPQSSIRKKWLTAVNIARHRALRGDFLQSNVLRSRLRLSACLVAAGYDRFMRDWLATTDTKLDDAVFYFYWGRGPAYGIEELRSKTNNRIVVRLHGYDLFEDRNAGYIPLREQVFAGADKLCSVSEAGRRYLAERYPAHAAKMMVSRLGTNDHGEGHFAPDDARLTIVSCANLVQLKRIPLLAEMLSGLPKRSIDWHHFGDGADRHNVEQHVAGFAPHVRATLHGQRANAEVIDFFRTHHVDAFISVSETEGVPVSIMEATSFGIPVIATDVGGTAEILTQEGAVLLPPQFSRTEFEAAIESVAVMSKDRELRNNIRDHWRQVAHAETNYEAFVRDVLLGSP